MESLKLNTGVKRVLINDGPDVLEFNPSDISFVERFYQMITEYKARMKEFEQRANEIEKKDTVDEDGVPLNISERIKFVRELCQFCYSRIDQAFGEGTSQKVFQGVENLEVVEQFFSGLLPMIQDSRKESLAKYSSKQDSSVLK